MLAGALLFFSKQKINNQSFAYVLSLIYFFSFFSKLNSGFFNPEFSCSNVFTANILNLYQLPELKGALVFLPIIFTLLIEGVLCLIFIKKLQKYLIPLSLFFHLILAFDLTKDFINFSSVMYFFLIQIIINENNKLIKIEDFYKKILIPVLILFVSFILLNFEVLKPGSFMLIKLIIFMLIYSFVFSHLKFKPSLKSSKLSYSFYVVLILVTLNGLSPYLGFKNRTSFNMYGNLFINEKESNHFIVPKSLDLLGINKDSYLVIESDLKELDSYIEDKIRITSLELNSLLIKNPKALIKVESNNFIPNKNISKFKYKLLHFKGVSREVEKSCIW